MGASRWVWAVWCVWCWGCAGAVQRPQCGHAPQRCEVLGGAHDEYTYSVDGEEHNIKFKDGGYFSMKCGIKNSKITLDNEALPRFTDEVRVSRIFLIDCAPPKQSYAQVLRRLHVVAVTDLIIRHAPGTISGAHLAGLTMNTLALVETGLAADAFNAYNAVQLRLDTVTSVAIENLPASLQYLHLVEVGINNLTRADFQTLPALSKLTVRQEGTIYVEAMESLTELALQAGSVWLDPALPDKLEKVTLTNGGAQQALEPWKSCKGLKVLVIDGDANITLPKGWLADCASLSNLSVKNSGLERLPNRLLDNSSSLSFLNLSGNRLKELPSGLFAKTRHLTVLDLSDNKLTSDTFSKLVAVTSLHELWLNGNKQLGDACKTGNAASLLEDLRSLRQLHLRDTGATVVCRDFRENMALLEKLDLGHNNITQLTYSDLRFEATKEVAVDLSGNDVKTLLYLHEEYRRLVRDRGSYCGRASPRASRASFALDAELSCDCRSATAALALRDCPGHVRLPALRCAAARDLPAAPLAARHLDEFVCALPPAACPAPAPCACAERWRAGGEGRAGGERVLRVQCAGAALGGAPPLPRELRVAWQLLLANASVAELRRADLPQNLIALDLRGNPLASLDPAIVEALPADGRLWLANDSLSCACDNAPGLAALLRRRDLVQNFADLRCAGGAPLRLPQCGGPGLVLAAALAPPLLLAALAAALLARRSTRARLKRALRGLGVLPPRAEPADERPFDVFVSFSHLDAEVVTELLAGLEPRYRVCVHFRDWAPGAWIPAQIAASVRRSRRTLAVVSAHFLRSAWARAEFREAHAAALRDAEPRLVVVLLDEPARLPLDAELRRYLAANTYVRWGDAWFWRKLRAALPPPRAPHPAAPAPPPPLSPEPLTGAAA